MSIVWKGIKPKRLNDKAMRKALLDEMRTVGDEMLKRFHETTETWDHKPKFEKLFQLSKGEVVVFVGTDDEIYGYVSNGTEDHWIYPIQAEVLAFPAFYSPKTSPGSISSSPGGGFGDTVTSHGHEVSGIEPRLFDEQIQEEFEKPFKRRMERAMKMARDASDNAA